MRYLTHDTQGWHIADIGDPDTDPHFAEMKLQSALLLHILRKLESGEKVEAVPKTKSKIRHFYRRRDGSHVFVEGSQIYDVVASGIFRKGEDAIHRLLSDEYQEEGAEQ